jgi:leucyl-tRNA synthetase
MSKSMGNVVPADQMMDRYGADTARIFILFASPPEKELEWSDKGVEGSFRFLGRVHRLIMDNRSLLSGEPGSDGGEPDQSTRSLLHARHRTVRKVTEDIDRRFQFNTAIAAIMELVNELNRFLSNVREPRGASREVAADTLKTVILLLAPFAPHLAEELWESAGMDYSVFQRAWPEYDTEIAVRDTVEMVVQVNGKVRARFDAAYDTSEEELRQMALDQPRISEVTADRQILKVVVVPGRLVSIVLK